jgi:hypothetical protein
MNLKDRIEDAYHNGGGLNLSADDVRVVWSEMGLGVGLEAVQERPAGERRSAIRAALLELDNCVSGHAELTSAFGIGTSKAR